MGRERERERYGFGGRRERRCKARVRSIHTVARTYVIGRQRTIALGSECRKREKGKERKREKRREIQ